MAVMRMIEDLGRKFNLRNAWKFCSNMSLFHRVNTTVGEKRSRQVLQGTGTLDRFHFGRVIAGTSSLEVSCEKETTMTRLKMWTGVCVAFVLVSIVVSGMAVPLGPKVQDPQVQDKIFEGTLVDIDQNVRVLTLKAGDNQMQFSYTDQTELVAPTNDGKPAAVRQGTKMRVHYTENEKAKIATKIEIIEL
jgi:hypothetical protein